MANESCSAEYFMAERSSGILPTLGLSGNRRVSSPPSVNLSVDTRSESGRLSLAKACDLNSHCTKRTDLFTAVTESILDGFDLSTACDLAGAVLA